jgi:hypothetical protein
MVEQGHTAMAMTCPNCTGTFEQQQICPTCDVRLVADEPAAPRVNLLDNAQWQQTPWGRIFVGLLLAQGLSHALRLLSTAFLLAATDASGRNVWGTLYGLILLQSFQAISLIAGGAVTGAGQQRGVFYGCVLGVGNGLCFIILQLTQGQSLTEVALFGQPILHLAFGAVGGQLGSMIWPPLPALRPPTAASLGKPNPVLSTLKKSSLFSGPVAWMRVLAGIGIAVGGAVWTRFILDLVISASHGQLSLSTSMQAQLVTWEIFALAMLVGGGLGGATTFNGPKQGLCVGLGTCALLIGFQVGASNIVLSELLFTSATTICLTVAGGWFGSQLLPPVLTRAQIKRIRSCGSVQ